MIRLIASDLDGTLMGVKDEIPSSNLTAINAINNSHIDFTICTGKTYAMIKNTCENLNASYGIFGNGNQIINLKTGEELYKKTLTIQEVQQCIHLSKSYHLHVHLYTNDSVITEKLLYMDLRNYKLKNSPHYSNSLNFIEVDNIEQYVTTYTPEILKLVISSTHSLSAIQKLLQTTTDLSICRIKKYDNYRDEIIDKEYEYLDITPTGINKHEALQILGNHLHLQQDEVMAIGDNLNDLDMIKHSGIGIAVANAYDEVKEVATYTTKETADNGGFAEAVYKYIEF